MAQAPVVAFHRLLGIDQPLLQLRARTKIASERDHLPAAADLHGRVQHRHIVAAFRRMIDLAPAAIRLRRRVAQQGFDLAATFERDGFRLWLADPLPAAFEHHVVAAQRDIPDHAIAVEHERDIGSGGDQIRCRFGIQFTQPAARRLHLIHGRGSFLIIDDGQPLGLWKYCWPTFDAARCGRLVQRR